jgi:hypothetical protein
MARPLLRTQTLLSLLLAILLAFFPARVGAVGMVELSSPEDFIEMVSNGEADDLRGIYVPGLLTGWVVQQPEGEPNFVSSHENTLTQFGLAGRFGSTGLLAHSTLAGSHFSKLKPGKTFTLIYGDGRTESFVVRQVLRYQALDPLNHYSTFMDLSQGNSLSASELFLNIYDQPGRVILQTCIDTENVPSWGRLFVIAEPASR